MTRLYLLFVFIFFLSCSKTQSENNLKLVSNVLEENKKVYELFLAQGNAKPDLTGLKEAVRKASVSADKESLKKSFSEMLAVLESANQSETAGSISVFSEKLYSLLKAEEINLGYRKFYCPMEKKFWLAKGDDVKNPYAPEMRECGELVQE